MTVRHPFPFLVCCPRSGSTLLRAMLNNHSELCVAPESHFIPQWFVRHPGPFLLETFCGFLADHPRFAQWDLDAGELARLVPPPANPVEAFRALYRMYAGRRGKSRYADKTPGYARHIPSLVRWFPEAVFIHLVHDPRNVALSLLEAPFGPTTLDESAAYWIDRVVAARRDGTALGPACYVEIRYEDLVTDPVTQLQRICRVAGLTYEPGMHRHQRQAADVIASTTQPEAHRNVARPLAARRSWQQEMRTGDAERFEAACGGVLAEFGY